MIDTLLNAIANTAGLTTYRIGLLQTKAYRILNQETAKVLRPYSITPMDWAMIGLLYENKEMRFSELAEELGVEASFITERAQELEKQKWITVTSAQNDRRAKHIQLTPQARTKVPKVETQLVASMRILLSDASISELRGYKKTLEKIVQKKPEK